MAVMLDGKIVSKKILDDVRREISEKNLFPKIEIVYVGNDPASEIYIKNKVKTAYEIGVSAHVTHLTKIESKEEVISTIDSLNADSTVNGIIVQSPIQGIRDESAVFNRIAPEKDIDGFSDANLGKLARGDTSGLISCTPLGIHALLTSYKIDISGKHVVIIGRSTIVGRPLSILLSQKLENCNATVTLCHSGTKNLSEITKMADIVVVAVGKKHFLKRNMIAGHPVVVDVGINREFDANDGKSYKLFGDADFEDIKDMCSAITPVPGGVGPMTVAMLMQNAVKATKMQM